MTKVEYISASHREANRKLRTWLYGVRRRLDDKSRVLGWLWRVAAWIIFGVVWTVGWLTFIVTLFRDVRYTTHFMECEIGDKSPEDAREYLLDKQREYTRRLSYGSVPVKEQKRIDKTFEYLFAKYPAPIEEPAPDPAVERHEQVMGSVAEVKTVIDGVADYTDRKTREDAEWRDKETRYHTHVAENLAEVKTAMETVVATADSATRESAEHHEQIIGEISEVKSSVKTVATYTDRKTREDAEREQRETAALVAAEKRRERHRSKTGFEPHPVDFSPKLSDAQFALLTKHMNEIGVFQRDVTTDEVVRLFMCEHTEPLRTTHNKVIALLLERLSSEGLITPKWQQVAADRKCFTSKYGKPLTAKDLSSAKQTAELIPEKKYKMILDSIDEVKRVR